MTLQSIKIMLMVPQKTVKRSIKNLAPFHKQPHSTITILSKWEWVT